EEEAEREAAERARAIIEELEKQAQDEEDEPEPPRLQQQPEPEGPPVFAPVFVPGEATETATGSELTAEQYQASNRLRDLRQTTYIGVIEEEEPLDNKQEIVDRLPERVRVAIVGRPNVGKSTLVNTLSGEQRSITSDIAGTTRDSVDLDLKRDGQQYVLVDTAGIRKKARISDRVEQYSAMRTLRALSECDVAVVVIDATDGPNTQDTKIAGIAHEQGRGLVIAINKWDLVEKNNRTVKQFTDKVREEMKFAPYAEVVFISAKSGKRCPRIIEAVKQAARSRERRVPTSMLNKVLRRAVTKNSLPVYRGRPLKLYFAAQVGTSPPRFVLFFNFPRAVHFSYLRFLKNALREEFGYEGTDIKLVARKHSKRQLGQ
ncbi:MAG: ribosome biogenesis GTPase Der, partial [Bdellovibrionales bacterium]|nr:ribosome biogenesis GTPase Der [Bdellovibrionales bacterium]